MLFYILKMYRVNKNLYLLKIYEMCRLDALN